MLGRDSVPTRVYAYGAKRPHEGLDAYWAEERAMHRLRNALVEVERDRREAARAVVLAHRPDIAETEARLTEIEEEIETLRAEIRKRNAAARKRAPAGDPATARIAELRAERTGLIGRHDAEADPCECWRCRRRAAYADPAIVDDLAAVEAEAKSRQKAMYAAREMSWCNFNAVMQAMGSVRSGPPPRFVPWTGLRGRAVVQIQGGATWEELLAGVRQVQVRPLPLPEGAKPGGRRSRRPWHELRLRIGRDARGDDRSAWVEVRFALHRPIPTDARIQQVWLVRKRAGTQDAWSVQFVVARASGWARPDTLEASGTCGIDLRWRRVGDPPREGEEDRRPLLVAYVEGSDGHREELTIPAERIDALAYTDRLQGIRDREFDLARERLVRWLSERDDVPDWLREATGSLAQWRSAGRLAALAVRWRAERFGDDAEGYEPLEAWRAQDKHLADWEGAQRRNFERWRLDHYRRFAARLRWRYRTAVMEDADWRAVLARPPAEEADEPEVLNRRWFARIASPGLLRQTVQQSIEDTRLVDSAHTSRTCSICGGAAARDWDAVTEAAYRCEAGHQLPVWRNAARNLLAAVASGEVVHA